MNWVEALILGIIQGLTEFLPISSSGHLVLAQYFLDIDEPGVFLEIILHMGTLVAIIYYFFDEIKQLMINILNNKKESIIYLSQLIIATVPASCVGLLFYEIIQSAFTSTMVIGLLIITGLVVGATSMVNKRSNNKKLSFVIAFSIGLFQAFALLPGLSRSGLTISCALFLGIRHEEAARFSFFMAIPVLFGAGIIQLVKIDVTQTISPLLMLVGFISSAVSGYMVIDWLLSIITKHKFHLFSFYCFFIAALSFIIIH